MDMMEELENEGVKIDPSVFKQVRRGSFRRIVDSRTYIFSHRISNSYLNKRASFSDSTTKRSTRLSHT
jgi:hypothetical protein